MTTELCTERTRLRRWRDGDRDVFATMNAHPEVMRDLGGPIGREKSDAKLDRYAAVFDRYGYGRWVIERLDGLFLGYAELMPSPDDHPLGPHVEIGWRLMRSAWGKGYASEAGGEVLRDGFARVGLPEIVAYTAADNLRSQAVMERLRMRRDPPRDFTMDYGAGRWAGLVWSARPA